MDTSMDAPMDAPMDVPMDVPIDTTGYDAAAMNVVPALEALERAATVASLLAGPLATDARMLGELGDAADDDTTIRQRVRNGVADNSIVDQASCVSFNWTLRRVVLTFTDCTSEHTGLTIDGRLTMQVRLSPVRLEMSFTNLRIGGIAFDGTVDLRVAGALMAFRISTDVDLTWTIDEETSHVVLDNVTVDIDLPAATVGLSGVFSLDAFGLSTSGRLIDVNWALPDCHPSSGRARFDLESVAAIVHFLPETPTEGIVSVQLPPFPATQMMLLPVCPLYVPPPDGGAGDAGASDAAADGGT